MPRFLVIGTAKTGTTIISKTLQGSVPGAQYLMEPKAIGAFEKLADSQADNIVVKILFDHWRARPSLLRGLLDGEPGYVPDRVVSITRDPRDTLISAMMYQIHGQVLMSDVTAAQIEEWAACIRQKEQSPGSLSVSAMFDTQARIFGVHAKGHITQRLNRFLDYFHWLEDNAAQTGFRLSYEDFIDGRLEALEDYLGFPLTHQRDVGENLSRVVRSRDKGNWKSMLLEEDVSLLRDHFGPLLARFGYTDWTLETPERLDPAIGSEYVLRIAAEAAATKAQNQRGGRMPVPGPQPGRPPAPAAPATVAAASPPQARPQRRLWRGMA